MQTVVSNILPTPVRRPYNRKHFKMLLKRYLNGI